MFNENLMTLREANGLSQEELATRLNVDRQTVSEWEGGLSFPDANMLSEISYVFQIPIGELVGNDPDMLTATEHMNELLAAGNRRRRMILKTVAIIIAVALVTNIIMFAITGIRRYRPKRRVATQNTEIVI